jgi:hypothetical protein
MGNPPSLYPKIHRLRAYAKEPGRVLDSYGELYARNGNLLAARGVGKVGEFDLIGHGSGFKVAGLRALVVI